MFCNQNEKCNTCKYQEIHFYPATMGEQGGEDYICHPPMGKCPLDRPPDTQEDTGILSGLAQSIANKTGKAIAIEPAGIHAEPES